MNLWPVKYVGLPFKDGGRTIDGVDCWGLIALVLKNERSIIVNDYGEISASEMLAVARKMMDDSAVDPWTKIETPHAFDIAVMTRNVRMEGKYRHVPIHVGVMIDKKSVLHIEQRFDSVCVPIEHPDVRYRILGFYRHKELTS